MEIFRKNGLAKKKLGQFRDMFKELQIQKHVKMPNFIDRSRINTPASAQPDVEILAPHGITYP